MLRPEFPVNVPIRRPPGLGGQSSVERDILAVADGCALGDIPSRYGTAHAVRERFDRWHKAGHWAGILNAVSAAYEGDIQMIWRRRRADGRQGRFRASLHYRIDGVTLRLPPLRERREDIVPLFRSFVARSAERLGREPPQLAPSTGAFPAISCPNGAA